MSEQLAVNRTFRNRSAVDGEVLLATTRRIVVDDAWQDVLTHTAFSDYEHT